MTPGCAYASADKLPHNHADNKRMDGAAIKVPPHSMEAEQAVLGGLMLENEAWDTIADRLSEHDFYRYDHRLIFRAVETLAANNTPFDAITLSEHMDRNGLLADAGGLSYLGRLVQNTPSAVNIAAYADIVRDRSVLRQLIAAGTAIADSGFDTRGRDTRTLLDEAERRVFEIAEKGMRANQGFYNLRLLLKEVLEKVELIHDRGEPITGLATGYDELDKMTSGLHPGDLIIVAGRPAMGKTSFAMNIAEHAAMKEASGVAVFSMEMPAEQLAMRLLSSFGRVDQQRLRTGRLDPDEWPRLGSAIQLLSDAPLYIDDSPALSPNELRARTRRLVREQKSLGLIVVDYLQLMQLPGNKENRATEIAEISRSLKALAKELRVPVIALSQLNRSLEQRPNRRPMMSDLRECVSGDTQVLLADNTRLAIRDLVGQKPWLKSVDTSGALVDAQADLVWSVGRRDVLHIKLASGRSIRCTPEHRLFGETGFRPVAQLRCQDRLAVMPEFITPQRAAGKLVWDTICSIEAAGVSEVFDLTVPDYACWLANGIVSHNSGGIEQDADVILFVYRDEVYNEDSPDKGIAEIIIGKQRSGPTGVVRLTFLGQHTRFENFAPEVYIDEGNYE